MQWTSGAKKKTRDDACLIKEGFERQSVERDMAKEKMMESIAKTIKAQPSQIHDYRWWRSVIWLATEERDLDGRDTGNDIQRGNCQ